MSQHRSRLGQRSVKINHINDEVGLNWEGAVQLPRGGGRLNEKVIEIPKDSHPLNVSSRKHIFESHQRGF